METKSLHEQFLRAILPTTAAELDTSNDSQQEDHHGEILPSFVLVHNDNRNSVVTFFFELSCSC